MVKEFVGWEVELKDGKIIKEGIMEWREVPKKEIHRLSLFHYGGRRWDLVEKQSYFVKKRGSEVPGFPESHMIESRSIGFYEGANKICYTVNERTGEFKMEVISNK